MTDTDAKPDTDPAPPPDGCPYPDGCGPLRRLAEIMAANHQEIMRRLDGMTEWQDTTEIRMERRRSIDAMLDERLERVESLARAAGGSSGREAGGIAARPAKWAGLSGAAAGVAAIIWELIRLAGH